jgi:hypothetical protein
MGFTYNRTLYKLKFADADLEGLEVTARGTTINGLLKFVNLGAELDGLDADHMDPAELSQKLPAMFSPFAKVLVSWNLEDEDGTPVPATLEGLMDQEVPFVARVIEAYVTGIAQAPPPLPKSSGDGATTDLEASIPMIPAPENPPS